MKTHELKTWPGYFSAIAQGRKRFELRFNDRDFAVGDVLHLRSWNNETEEYDGRELLAAVDYFLSVHGGLETGYVLMSITLIYVNYNPDENLMES